MTRALLAGLNRRIREFALLIAFFCCAGGVSAQSLQLVEPDQDQKSEAAATLVVFNEADPDSRDLAKFYAEKRGIPRDQLVGLRCPTTEEISRAEFDSTIAEPLRRAFTSNFWWKLRDADSPLGPVEWNRIRFVALMRGVPLKVAATTNYPGDKPSGPAAVSQHNEASVDSELALLAMPHGISGAVSNPYYRSFSRIGDAHRPELLLVCRLDGPTPAIVKRMITDSIAAERNGLDGFAYVDSRGLAGDSGGLKEGDDWLLSLANSARKKGFPVILDNGPGLFPDGYPMRHAALYFGWYAEHVSGSFTQKGFRFEPGAIACHIHSFSAVTVRDAHKQWVGPLLAAGAAATVGNVYEPYLALTPHLDTIFERLTSGFTFAESAYMSQRALSWMTTFVGDPLYRPFPVLERADDGNRTNEWDAYHAGARTWFGQGRREGEAALQKSGRTMRSGVIFEGLGLLELTANANNEALAAFQEARRLYSTPEDILRASIHEAILLKGMGRTAEGVALAKKQTAAFPQAPAGTVFQLLFPELAPKPATPTTASAPVTKP
ncbi:TIGR03790 family protein [Verrucomicrobiota bacterium sgz303538]